MHTCTNFHVKEHVPIVECGTLLICNLGRGSELHNRREFDHLGQ